MRFERTLPALAVLALAAALPAWAHEKTYVVVLNGTNESPPNASPGAGVAIVTFDLDLFTMSLQGSFVNLLGTTSAAHIHCCTAVAGVGNVGVATQTPSFTGFPLGVSLGSFNLNYDMSLASSYNAAFITNNGGTVSTAFTALLNGIDAGKAYLNIHTTFASGGEIRGFLLAPVPEPGTYGLMLGGLAAVGLAVRRRQKAG